MELSALTNSVAWPRLRRYPRTIDKMDIPEAPAENWRHARRGDLYRQLKRPVTIRLDADVLAWFKEHTAAEGYQTGISRVLRKHVTETEKRSSTPQPSTG